MKSAICEMRPPASLAITPMAVSATSTSPLPRLHERDHRLAPEGAIGFLVIAIGVVAGQAEQQRRHAESERDLARGRGFRLGKIHVLARDRWSPRK
jgi:hypothetical protein